MHTDETDGDILREGLIEALTVDPEGDGFTFAVGNPQAIGAGMGGGAGDATPFSASASGQRINCAGAIEQ